MNLACCALSTESAALVQWEIGSEEPEQEAVFETECDAGETDIGGSQGINASLNAIYGLVGGKHTR